MNTLVFLGGAIGLVANKWTSLDKHLDLYLKFILEINISLTAFVSICYLLYPSYLDHVSSTIATLGVIYLKGGQIYPDLTEYSMHGLLYGPALSEISAVFSSLGWPVIFSSKIPGVIALNIYIVLLFLMLKDNFSKAYLILLMPFTHFLFWNRAEPFLILLTTLTLWSLKHSNTLRTALIVGILAGLSSCIKLHAFLYIAGATTVLWQYKTINTKKILIFLVGFVIAFIVCFSPAQVSIPQFLNYIDLAGKHGLSIGILKENIFYLLGLSLPVFYLLICKPSLRKSFLVPTLLLIFLEVIVSLIGSKPGAGAHHLMPFIPINAFLLYQFFIEAPLSKSLVSPFKYGFLIVGLVSIFIWCVLIRSMFINYHYQDGLATEVNELGNKYPGVIFGISDDLSYDHVFFRPIFEMKGTRQFDYPAFMDLNFSGVSDNSFSNAIKSCRFPYIAVPKSGVPFSINNPYTGMPLFSNNVRLAFSEKYKILPTQKNYYVIYVCKY